jgi:hypothetical protein
MEGKAKSFGLLLPEDWLARAEKFMPGAKVEAEA